jgi:hypothetical protein
MTDVINKDKIDAFKKALDEANEALQIAKGQYDKAESSYNTVRATSQDLNDISSTVDLNNNEILNSQVNDKKEANVKLEKKAKNTFEQSYKALEAAQKNVILAQEHLNIVFAKKSLKNQTDKSKEQNKTKIEGLDKKIKSNKIALKKDLQQIINIAGPAAVIYGLSRVLNNQINRMSQTIQDLDILVDKTNDTIRKANTKQDIQKANILRNAALLSLNSAENQIQGINNTIQNISRTLSIVNLILNVLSVVPFDPYFITSIGVRISRIMAKINPVIISLSILVQVSSGVLDGFLSQIQYEKNRLLPLNKVLDAVHKDTTPSELNSMLDYELSQSTNGLGPVDGVEYKGFTFSILEEDDPRYVVAGNKRRYAVALDRSGFIALQSKPSFTLDPNVLIEELKLEINNQNIEA